MWNRHQDLLAAEVIIQSTLGECASYDNGQNAVFRFEHADEPDFCQLAYVRTCKPLNHSIFDHEFTRRLQEKAPITRTRVQIDLLYHTPGMYVIARMSGTWSF